MASKVYFMNDRANNIAENTQNKGIQVLRDAGIAQWIKPGDKVGIKVHMGEWGNSHNLRPHWVSSVVDEVKKYGGIPAIVEGSTVPSMAATRWLKKDHLETARHHGFTEETMGCPIEILDGENGFDDYSCPVKHGVLLKNTFAGKGIKKFDKFIVVSHFKGHGMGVFGGALKNVGIGMASPRGKNAVHFVSNKDIGVKSMDLNLDTIAAWNQAPHPNLIDVLVNSCPGNVFEMNGDTLTRDVSKCINCADCFLWNLMGIYKMNPTMMTTWAPAIADSAAGIIQDVGEDNWMFLNYAYDLTPACDCNSFHDRAMIPNIGVFASKDPVAVDMACIEAAEAEVAIPGSVADEYGFSAPNTERFTNCSSMAKQSQWQQINTAVFNGVGSSEYELVYSKVIDPNSPDWQPPMRRNDNCFLSYKDVIASGEWEPGDYAYDPFHPKMPYEELNKKPKGKVTEMDI